MSYNRNGALNRIHDAQLVKVSLDYLRKGDRFVAIAGFHQNQVSTGVVAMDGHGITNNAYYKDNPDEGYINVKFDGLEYTDLRPNDSIYSHENWIIYVSPEIAKRIDYDKKSPRQRELERELDALRERLSEVKQELRSL